MDKLTAYLREIQLNDATGYLLRLIKDSTVLITETEIGRCAEFYYYGFRIIKIIKFAQIYRNDLYKVQLDEKFVYDEIIKKTKGINLRPDATLFIHNAIGNKLRQITANSFDNNEYPEVLYERVALSNNGRGLNCVWA